MDRNDEEEVPVKKPNVKMAASVKPAVTAKKIGSSLDTDSSDEDKKAPLVKP